MALNQNSKVDMSRGNNIKNSPMQLPIALQCILLDLKTIQGLFTTCLAFSTKPGHTQIIKVSDVLFDMFFIVK